MTFTQIKAAIKDYCLLTSTEADTRVGAAINRHYRRITSSLGMDATRFVTRTAIATDGVQTVTVSEIEKIDRVLDISEPLTPRLLAEVSVHALRAMPTGSGPPQRWALQHTAADAVTIVLDVVPTVPFALQADGWTTLTDLSGTDEPVFPESFHDVLVWAVIAEELLKKEKLQLAGTYENKAQALLADLRFHLADSHTRETRQAGGPRGPGTGGASGGGLGGSAYTQTGLITFDRDPDPPFAVTDGSAYVPNLLAEGLGNVPTDRLIGRDTAGTGDSEHLTVSGGLAFTGSGGIQVAADGVTYAQLQNVSAASRVLGRGSAAGAGDPEEITLGTNLSMSGTTLNVTTVAAGAAGSDTQVQFNDGGAFGADSGLTFNKTTDALTVGGDLVFSSNAAIRRNTSLGAQTGALTLSGAGSVAPADGAFAILFGNQHANAGDITLGLGTVAGAQLQVLQGDGTAALTVDGATGTLTVSGPGKHVVRDVAIHAGAFICRNTGIGANSGYLGIAGGGDLSQSEGAVAIVYGNQNAGHGDILLGLGNVASAELRVVRSDALTALTINGATGVMAVNYGIQFPATQVPSTNANTLDDYEEGTWTPTIGGTTSASGQAYSTQSGSYQKVGKCVHVWYLVALSTLGTITGSARLEGLPFPIASLTAGTHGVSMAGWAGTTTAATMIFAFPTEGTSTAILGIITAATTNAFVGVTQANMANTTQVRGQFSYLATT